MVIARKELSDLLNSRLVVIVLMVFLSMIALNVYGFNNYLAHGVPGGVNWSIVRAYLYLIRCYTCCRSMVLLLVL